VVWVWNSPSKMLRAHRKHRRRAFHPRIYSLDNLPERWTGERAMLRFLVRATGSGPVADSLRPSEDGMAQCGEGTLYLWFAVGAVVTAEDKMPAPMPLPV
jgi:hypothetical protein